MGASESGNPIRNMDKRTARREYAEDFKRGIQQYRALQKYRENLNGVVSDAEVVAEEANVWEDGDLKVFVRKRPIFKREIDLGEFDVVTCFNDRNIVIHDARMHTDMKKQFLNHHKFQFDHVFNDRIDNLSVYTITTAPLVKIASEGGYATCFV